MFDWKKPTVQLLGRYQPWHAGHTELFKKAHAKTGQVCIMVRDTYGTDEKNPFDIFTVSNYIREALAEEGFEHGYDYVIMDVPNIVNITYGRDVGYVIEKEYLGEEIESISATKIREEMRIA